MSKSVVNFMLKVVAVLLAVLLWFYVVNQKTYEHTLILPVTEVDYPPGLGPVTPPPDSLTIRVTGEGKDLMGSDWKRFGVRLRATRLNRGNNQLDFNLETVSLVRAEDITLLGIETSGPIAIQLDRLDTLLKPVVSRLAVVPDRGHMVDTTSVTINPIKTSVVGPSQLLRQVDTIYTAQKIIDDVDSPVSMTLPLENPQPYAFAMAHDSATIEMNVGRRIEKTIRGVPLRITNGLPARTIIDPDKITVEFEGLRSVLDTLTNQNIEAGVAAVQDGYAVPFVVPIPNVSVISIQPDSIRVQVSP